MLVSIQNPLRFGGLFMLGGCISCIYFNRGVEAKFHVFIPAQAKSSVVKKNQSLNCMHDNANKREKNIVLVKIVPFFPLYFFKITF